MLGGGLALRRCCHVGLASRYIADIIVAMAERNATPELRGRAGIVAMSLVFLALGVGSFWGWRYAGPLGGLLGLLFGTAIGAVAFTIVRAKASSGRLDTRPAVDVHELPPDRAMQVLTALMSGAGESGVHLTLEGGLLGELGKARAQAQSDDVAGALAQLETLAQQHPHSPAVPAEIVQLLAGDSARTDDRLRAASKAITLAIRGGMGRLAIKVYEQLDEAERDRLELDGKIAEQLAKTFATRGDEASATRLLRTARSHP